MYSRTKRYTITTVGAAFVLVGIPGLFLPILQGALLIVVGFIILSMTYPPAAHVVAQVKSLHPIAARLVNRSEEFVERMVRFFSHKRRRALVRNGRGHTLAVIADVRRTRMGEAKGVALMVHGVGGAKEDPVMRALASGAREAGFQVVRMDAANNCNESKGAFSDLTATGMHEDLRAVRRWLSTQPFAKGQPLVLLGHSLGGLCVLHEAADHPEEITAVATMGATIAGVLTIEATEAREPGSIARWREQGYQISEGVACRAPYNRLSYAHLEDRMQYDIRTRAEELSMPVLLMVGSEDTFTPVHHQRDLTDRLQGRGTLSIVEEAPHAPIELAHLQECQNRVCAWLSNLVL